MANNPISVYVSPGDKIRVEAVANELGVSRHALMQYAVLDFVARYEAGEAKPKIATQPVLIPFEEAQNGES